MFKTPYVPTQMHYTSPLYPLSQLSDMDARPRVVDLGSNGGPGIQPDDLYQHYKTVFDTVNDALTHMLNDVDTYVEHYKSSHETFVKPQFEKNIRMPDDVMNIDAAMHSETTGHRLFERPKRGNRPFLNDANGLTRNGMLSYHIMDSFSYYMGTFDTPRPGRYGGTGVVTQ